MDNKFLPAEIAAAHVPPHGLSPEEKTAADSALWKMRLDLLRGTGEQQRILAGLARLKFQMEDFLNLETSSEAGGFAGFLQQYAQILNRSQAVLSAEISLHPTKLNQIMRGKCDPNQALFYRLEKHSGRQIPAILWWKVFSKKLEHNMAHDNQARQLEEAKVTVAFQLA